MGARNVLMAGLARQLGRPSGVPGRLIMGRLLNRHNRSTLAAAVDALDPRAGQVAADIGFGGGLGLSLLLDRVGPSGRVHGVDISSAVLRAAAARFRRESARGRLRLHPGSITELPLEDASVDGVITVNTIYFVADLDRAFAEVARVLVPSGRFVVGLGDPTAMAAEPVTAHGFRLRPVDEVASALAAAGLPVIDHRRVGTGDGAFHLLLARSS
jgi:arsenite methyltransferase